MQSSKVLTAGEILDMMCQTAKCYGRTRGPQSNCLCCTNATKHLPSLTTAPGRRHFIKLCVLTKRRLHFDTLAALLKSSLLHFNGKPKDSMLLCENKHDIAKVEQ